MSDGPAFQRLVSSHLNEAEELLAELQLSIDRLRILEVPHSEFLVAEIQTLVDEIRIELGGANLKSRNTL